MIKNDLFLRALKGETVDRPPVWMMRQAGRYLPEFIALRDKYDFFTRCRTPELASEITVQPIRRYGMDAAILFSDILVIPQAMNIEVEMKPNFGPYLPNPVRNQKGVDNVISVSNAFDLEVDSVNDKLKLKPLLNKTITSEEEVVAFKKRLLELPFYKNLLYSEDGNVIILIVRITQEALYDKQIITTIEEIKAINEHFEAQQGIKIHASGLPYIRMANTKKLEKEVYLLIFFTILIIRNIKLRWVDV